MDAKEELAALRRMAELEDRVAKTESDSSLSDVMKYGPGFLKESAQSIGRGALNMGNAAASHLLRMMPGQEGVDAFQAENQQKIEGILPKQDDSYFTRAMEGVGGMLGPGNLKELIARTMTGATGGIGAKAGGDYAGSVNPNLKPVGELVGGVLGGGIPAVGLTGQKQSEAILRKAVEGTPAAEWVQGHQNLRDFQQSGAQTATLIDAMNRRPRLVALGNELNMNPGGEAFSNQVANRERDLTGLGDEFLTRIGPQTSVNQTANRASDSANSVLENARDLRSTAYRNSLAGVNITRSQAGSVHRNLLAMANNPRNTDEVRAAYQAVADRMLRDEGRAYITDLQDLGLNLKSLKRNPPGLDSASGSKIDAETIRRAIVDAEAFIGQVSPRYQQANDEFSRFSQQFVRPLREGPVGKMADKNPNLPDPTPAGRLDQLMGKDNSAADINTALFNLRDPSQTQMPVSSAEIARAVYQRQLDKGSTNPGQTVRGLPDSPADARLQDTLTGAGLNAGHVTQPLRAADNLQNFKKPPMISSNDQPRSALGALFTPFRRGEFELTKRARESNNQEIAALLAQPTGANLERLREISMFDPNVRKMIATQLMIYSGNAGQGAE
jgi:hypothetical protein